MKRTFGIGRIICFVLFVLMTVCAVSCWQNDLIVTDTSANLIPAHKKNIGMLNTETPAVQTFVATQDGLNGIDVMVNRYNKKPKNGSIRLVLSDAGGAIIGEAEIPVSEIKKDNVWVSLDFPMIAGSANNVYTLSATSDCTDEKGVTLRMGPADSVQDGVSLTLPDGSADAEGNMLHLRMRFSASSHNWMSAATCLLIAFCFLTAVPLSKKHKEDDRHA